MFIWRALLDFNKNGARINNNYWGDYSFCYNSDKMELKRGAKAVLEVIAPFYMLGVLWDIDYINIKNIV